MDSSSLPTVAFSQYLYVTYLGYNALPFLIRSELLLFPVVVLFAGWVQTVRCKGLFSAIVIDKDRKSKKGRSAWDLCLLMASKGVLAKPTHQNT